MRDGFGAGMSLHNCNPQAEPGVLFCTLVRNQTAAVRLISYSRRYAAAAAQPCRRFAASKAAMACLTTSLVVTPRSAA
jgi:hypothetical protein